MRFAPSPREVHSRRIVGETREDDVEISPAVVIWRLRHNHHLLRCVMEQVGEECFELKVYSGKEVLADEPFDEVDGLLERASELRVKFTHH